MALVIDHGFNVAEYHWGIDAHRGVAMALFVFATVVAIAAGHVV